MQNSSHAEFLPRDSSHGIPWEEFQWGGILCGKNTMWEKSYLGGIPWEESRVEGILWEESSRLGVILLGGILWEVSRWEEYHDYPCFQM